MPRRTHDDELESGSINLLPDEMRSAEEKDRISSRSNESPYQLRAPKRERKRRRFFTWLPFFGGEHWESGGRDVAHARVASQAAETARVSIPTQGRPEDLQQPLERTSKASPIVPIYDERIGSVSPKSLKGFKTGFSFSGLFSWFGVRGKRTRAPAVIRTETPPVQTPDFPSRHYSLQEEHKKIERTPVVGPAPPPVVPSAARPDDMGLRTGGMMATMPQKPAAASTMKAPKLRRGFRWPRWLDIFYLIELMTAPGPHRATRPQQPQQMEPPRMPSIATTPASKAPVTNAAPFSPPAPVAPGIGASAPMRPIISVPEPRRKKPRKPFSLFRWLNIFAWFRTGPKRPKAPMPAFIRPAAASHPSASPARITPELSPLPAASQPTPSVPPSAPVPELRPVVPLDAARPVPEPSRQSFAGASPITPITPEPERGRQGGSAKTEKPRTGFHVPGKLNLEELSMQFKDVNLIPGEYTIRRWRSIIRSLVMAVAGVAALAAISYALLNMEESRIKSRSAQIDLEIQKFKNDILFYKQQEPVMTSVSSRIELVKQLLGTHIYWTNFFAMLEKYTLPEVHYDGISATPTGKLSLSAHGTNFETVSKALRLLSSPAAAEFVSTVSITGAHQASNAEGETQVDFVIELSLNPDLFYYRDGQAE
ncbi:MAG: hypothetical protein HY422_01740 [Candidatus Komeilibacteria bacterium]|nr:hypothetical protein [Candidatus Komeilibacteria bacterium]